MSINVVFKSPKSLSYISGQAEFFVNWNNFFPEDESYCEYSLSFSYISQSSSSLAETDLYALEVDVGTSLQILGTSDTNQNANAGTDIIIGMVKPEKVGTNFRMVSDYLDNPPVLVKGRPSNNMVKITLKDLTGTISQKNPQFLCILRFEKLKKDEYN
tara:strand:- start:4346 stop:4819 length:474 start_codon:yes stop_codon:yes gene_type:complete